MANIWFFYDFLKPKYISFLKNFCGQILKKFILHLIEIFSNFLLY